MDGPFAANSSDSSYPRWGYAWGYGIPKQMAYVSPIVIAHRRSGDHIASILLFVIIDLLLASLDTTQPLRNPFAICLDRRDRIHGVVT